jgi:hypothetical protein
MLIADFWNFFCETSGGCWEWTLSKSRGGYGKVSWYGKSMRAHRVAWMLENGKEIPPDKVVMHSCDNRLCINPAHLSIGTPKQNSEDMVSKGRARGGSPPGELASKSKLTEEDVVAMRFLRRSKGLSYAKLGRMFGIAAQNARLACLGITWFCVPKGRHK